MNVTRNHESEDHCWATIKDALSLDLTKATRELLVEQMGKLNADFKISQKTIGTVSIEALEFNCIIGILPEERKKEQTLRIFVEMDLDMAEAARTKEVDLTVDYANTAELLKAGIKEKQYGLLETLVEEQAAVILKDPKVKKVRLRAEKPEAVDHARACAVSVERFNPLL